MFTMNSNRIEINSYIEEAVARIVEASFVCRASVVRCTLYVCYSTFALRVVCSRYLNS